MYYDSYLRAPTVVATSSYVRPRPFVLLLCGGGGAAVASWVLAART